MKAAKKGQLLEIGHLLVSDIREPDTKDKASGVKFMKGVVVDLDGKSHEQLILTGRAEIDDPPEMWVHSSAIMTLSAATEKQKKSGKKKL